MRALRVPVRLPSEQLPLIFIAAVSGLLSFWLTVRFCAQLCPRETALELLAMGVLWESSKLVFGGLGVRKMGAGPRAHRLRGLLLVLVSVVLAAGSIAASLGFLVQTDSRSQRQSLASSEAYRRAQARGMAIDREIQIQADSAAQDMAFKFRARGLQSLEKLAELRRQRSEIDAVLSHLEAHSEGENGAFLANVGALLPGDAMRNAAHMRLGGQCVLAVMLEVISLIALSLAGMSVSPKSTVDLDIVQGLDAPGRKPAEVHRRRAFQRRIENAAQRRSHRREGRGDTGVGDAYKSTRYCRAKEMMRQCRLQPSYRALQRTLEISQGTAQRYLQAMLAEGFLRRQGKRYALASELAWAPVGNRAPPAAG